MVYCGCSQQHAEIKGFKENGRLSASTREALCDRSAVITKEMTPPLLIVEVISKNYPSVDIVEKHQEYLDRQVPEY